MLKSQCQTEALPLIVKLLREEIEQRVSRRIELYGATKPEALAHARDLMTIFPYLQETGDQVSTGQIRDAVKFVSEQAES